MIYTSQPPRPQRRLLQSLMTRMPAASDSVAVSGHGLRPATRAGKLSSFDDDIWASGRRRAAAAAPAFSLAARRPRAQLRRRPGMAGHRDARRRRCWVAAWPRCERSMTSGPRCGHWHRGWSRMTRRMISTRSPVTVTPVPAGLRQPETRMIQGGNMI